MSITKKELGFYCLFFVFLVWLFTFPLVLRVIWALQRKILVESNKQLIFWGYPALGLVLFLGVLTLGNSLYKESQQRRLRSLVKEDFHEYSTLRLCLYCGTLTSSSNEKKNILGFCSVNCFFRGQVFLCFLLSSFFFSLSLIIIIMLVVALITIVNPNWLSQVSLPMIEHLLTKYDLANQIYPLYLSLMMMGVLWLLLGTFGTYIRYYFPGKLTPLKRKHGSINKGNFLAFLIILVYWGLFLGGVINTLTSNTNTSSKPLLMWFVLCYLFFGFLSLLLGINAGYEWYRDTKTMKSQEKLDESKEYNFE